MRKRRFIAWIFVFAVIVSAIILFSLSLPRRVVVPNQLKNDIPVAEIYGEKKIGQTFTAKFNNLSAVEILDEIDNIKKEKGITRSEFLRKAFPKN